MDSLFTMDTVTWQIRIQTFGCRGDGLEESASYKRSVWENEEKDVI